MKHKRRMPRTYRVGGVYKTGGRFEMTMWAYDALDAIAQARVTLPDPGDRVTFVLPAPEADPALRGRP